MNPVANKKGLSFVAARDYVLNVGGRARWEAVLAALPPDDAEIVGAAVGIGWYPLSLYARMMRTIDRQVGTGDLRAIPAIVRFEAERDVPTIHRLLLKMVRTSFVLEKMADLWPRYHSSGRLQIERRDSKSVDATLVDWGADDVLCVGFQAYCTRVLELAGASDVRITHPTCRARGAALCLFRARWS